MAKVTPNQAIRNEIREQGNHILATRLSAIEDGVERLTAYSFNNHEEAVREASDLIMKLEALKKSFTSVASDGSPRVLDAATKGREEWKDNIPAAIPLHPSVVPALSEFQSMRITEAREEK